VVVIPDQKKIIISQIRKLKNQYDFVITTGGIGPTHDDITSESISLAVKKKYKLHNGAYRELKKYYTKIKSELTGKTKVIATGGLSKFAKPLKNYFNDILPTLTLDGMIKILDKNNKKKE